MPGSRTNSGRQKQSRLKQIFLIAHIYGWVPGLGEPFAFQWLLKIPHMPASNTPQLRNAKEQSGVGNATHITWPYATEAVKDDIYATPEADIQNHVAVKGLAIKSNNSD